MSHSVEYYLSKGFDSKSVNYYANGRRKIIAVVANDDFTLTITFENNETRLLDMKASLKKGTVFEPFMDINKFKQVYLDDTNAISWDINPDIDSKVVWSNKVDICPDTCYMNSQLIS